MKLQGSPSGLGPPPTPDSGAGLDRDYIRAVLNILEDFGAEKAQLQATQRAVLNILEDVSVERARLQDMQKAVLNILDDLALEKARLEAAQRELVRSEQAIRASHNEKEVLLKEIHHRVKNNLQVISSLLSLQAHYLPEPGVRQIFNECQNRVLSIALVHEKLYQSASLSHVAFSDYITSLLDNLLHTFDAAGRGITASIDVGDVHLPIDRAITCGLLINELVSNALKHAFPANRAGTLQIVLRRLSAQRLELQVRDDGIGLPEALEPGRTQSLGIDLIHAFAGQLDATVEITRDGGTCFRFLFAGGS